MKNIILLTYILLFNFVSYGQTNSTNTFNVATYAYGTEDVGFKVLINENNELQFVKIVDSLKLSKDELYSKVLSYFAYNYKDSKNVLELQDKVNGIVIGKGYFPTFTSYKDDFTYYFNKITQHIQYSANHIVRVDIKDGRLRYILTVSEYKLNFIPESYLFEDEKAITKCEPFNPDYSQYDELRIAGLKPDKKYMKFYLDIMKQSEILAFKDLCNLARVTISGFEKTIITGNSKIETENW